MSIADGQAEDNGEALARDAAHWFARMRSPDAATARADFEAWLAQGPEHRAAYNRAAEIFALGKLLAEPAPPPPAPVRRRRVFATCLAAAAIGVVAVGGWVASRPPGAFVERSEAFAGAIDHRRVATIAGETRTVRLADGSTVRLGDATILDIDIGERQRNLDLLQGQARFEVAHEERPFIVRAGGGSVTARGTIFDVALLRPGKVAVRLLRGAIDVALPRRTANGTPAIRKLVAGEAISFAAQPGIGSAAAAPSPTATLPSATPRDFQATPVADLVALANRGAVRPIRLADAALGAERVSGRFRVDDTGLLARRLAALFGRGVDLQDPREIVLGPGNEPAGAPQGPRGATAAGANG